jgi:hypothetical protein
VVAPGSCLMKTTVMHCINRDFIFDINELTIEVVFFMDVVIFKNGNDITSLLRTGWGR